MPKRVSSPAALALRMGRISHPRAVSTCIWGSTAEKLQKTERAEALLFSLGFRDFRVRYFAGAARIQLPEAQLPLALERRTELLSELKKIYPAVLLDLEVRG